MPFGLINAPATFQRTLDILLSGFQWKSCLVYIDDTIIFGKSFEEHWQQVDMILKVLQDAGVSLKLRKFDFFSNTVMYLGHVMKPGTLSIDEVKVKSLAGLQHPLTITELRSFLGVCNLYRRFVPGYTDIATPLNQLLKKGLPTMIRLLDPRQCKAFSTLATAITTPPLFALPKEGLPYSLDTDDSYYQVGAALFRTDANGKRKPIGYWSRSLNVHEKNYSTPEK